MRLHLPQHRARSAALAHVVAAHLAVLGSDDEALAGVRVPADLLRVGRDREGARRVGGAHIDDRGGPIEARGEHHGCLLWVPLQGLHLVFVVVERLDRALAAAAQVPQPHRLVRRRTRQHVALQCIPAQSHHCFRVTLQLVRARASPLLLLLLLVALAALARRRERLRRLVVRARRRRLRPLRPEHHQRLQRVDDVEVPHLDVRRKRADGDKGAALLRRVARVIHPSQAQREHRQRDVVVRVQVVLRLLVHVALEVAQVLI